MLQSLHNLSGGCLFLFFLIDLSYMGVHLPASISRGKIPNLSCVKRDLRYLDIMFMTSFSVQTVRSNRQYVRNLGLLSKYFKFQLF